MKNLVEIANKYFAGNLNENELKLALDKIEIFEPETIDEETIYFNGNGNSFLEVNNAHADVPYEKRVEFAKLVRELTR